MIYQQIVSIVTLTWFVTLVNTKICRIEIPHLFVSKKQFGHMNATNTRSYVELLKSDFYFDNSMLINFLLDPNEYRIIEVVIPSKWGKSITLDMMKIVLQIPVDDQGNPITPLEKAFNYQLFYKSRFISDTDENYFEPLKQPLHISRCDTLLDKVLGKFPVIYLDFSDMNATTYQDIIEITSERIKRAFLQHSYMEKVLQSNSHCAISPQQQNNTRRQLDHYRKIINKKANYEDLIKSIGFLSHLLYEHFGARSYLLVDNYDGILLNVLASPDISDVETPLALAFFSSLMLHTFQTNTYVEKGILTGTFPLLKLVPNLGKFKRYRGMFTSVLTLKYATNHRDLISLLEYLEIPQDVCTRALNWYSGHTWGKLRPISLYNTYSIAKFITTGRLDYCKCRNPIFERIFRNTLTLANIRMFCIDKLFGDSREVLKSDSSQISIDEYLDLKNCLIGSKTHKTFTLEEALEPYLLSVGILSPNSSDAITTFISVSSNEARMDLADKLMDYYKTEFHISTLSIKTALKSLASFMAGRTPSCKGLLSFLQSLMRNDRLMRDVSEYDRSEWGSFRKFVLFVLNYFTLRATLAYNFIIEPVENYDLSHGKYRWHNLAIYRPIDKIVTFIELTVNASSAQNATALARQQKFRVHKICQAYKQIRFIGINIALNKTVQINVDYT
ncbi:uncharacterized protein LOC135836774 [Planococcus citri]|uniref:uncharacterized protein LOC135836774 n=1 Tax=Planococcus citri TaxID=170843 RepID=UPI0031F844BA